jgi:hypothetical protein
MLKTRSVVLLLLILGAGIVLGIGLNNSLMLKTVEAQQTFNAKWEYCRLSYDRPSLDNGRWFYHCSVEYFQQPSIKRETIAFESLNNSTATEDALSQAVARLGEQGWEMIQLERRENSIAAQYYFKRIKR